MKLHAEIQLVISLLAFGNESMGISPNVQVTGLCCWVHFFSIYSPLLHLAFFFFFYESILIGLVSLPLWLTRDQHKVLEEGNSVYAANIALRSVREALSLVPGSYLWQSCWLWKVKRRTFSVVVPSPMTNNIFTYIPFPHSIDSLCPESPAYQNTSPTPSPNPVLFYHPFKCSEYGPMICEILKVVLGILKVLTDIYSSGLCVYTLL